MVVLSSRFAILLSLSSLLCLSGCSSFSYVVDTGIGQWKLFNRARPVEDVLASPHTSPETKTAIHTVLAAKNFATKDLGLKATGSYREFVQLDGPFVSWAVSASHPLKLEEKKWKFPIVGELPYLGFFSREKADRFAATLKEESSQPDIWIRGVPAFSSLGWFSDPLYSSMIRGSERDIVDLVIHESLHATVWVGDSVDFNEKLASFVGLEGSIAYMQKKDSNGGAERTAREEVAGEKIFAEFINEALARYKRDIEALADRDANRALLAKAEFYRGLPHSFKDFFEKRKKHYGDIPFQSFYMKHITGWNNAALLAYANYYSNFSVFEAMLAKCAGDLSRFVRWIVAEKEAAEKNEGRFLAAPEEYLSNLVKQQNCVL